MPDLGTPARRALARVAWLAALTAAPPATAPAQLTPPTLRGWRPIGAAPGERLALEVRGAELERASAIRFDDPRVAVEGLEASKDAIRAAVTLPDDLPPGPLAFRVVTPRGLSEPGRMVVGVGWPRVEEVEPNQGFRSPQVVAAPAAIDGEIQDGDDVDLFAVDLEAGRTLVAEVVADRAGSGLDPLLTIFGPDGRELASEDDVFGRDAACWAVAPARGRYLVQLQDANGRNRNGNVESATRRPYRLLVGELPLAVSAFPAGARRGEATRLALLGANLPDGGGATWAVPADATLGDARLPFAGAGSLAVRVGDRPEYVEPEAEPAADPFRAPTVTVPAAINGRLRAEPGGDVDYYRLRVAPGDEGDYVLSALAARIGSPADPSLSVVDPRGESQAAGEEGPGRDARLVRRIDAEGIVIALRDAFGRGGPRFVYRIEVEPARPVVAATVDVGSRTLPRGGSLALAVTLDRLGDDGPVTLLAGPLPEGVSAAPVTIPARGRGGVLVLSARDDAPLGPWTLRLVARDAAAPVEFATRERWSAPGGPREAVAESGEPLLAVAEPATLGVAIEPREVAVPPGGEATITVRLDRRGESADKGLKVRLLAGDGARDGLQAANEQAVGADAAEAAFTIRARPGAAPRRLVLSARAWLDGGPEFLGVDAPAAMLIVPASP